MTSNDNNRYIKYDGQYNTIDSTRTFGTTLKNESNLLQTTFNNISNTVKIMRFILSEKDISSVSSSGIIWTGSGAVSTLIVPYDFAAGKTYKIHVNCSVQLTLDTATTQIVHNGIAEWDQIALGTALNDNLIITQKSASDDYSTIITDESISTAINSNKYTVTITNKNVGSIDFSGTGDSAIVLVDVELIELSTN